MDVLKELNMHGIYHRTVLDIRTKISSFEAAFKKAVEYLTTFEDEMRETPSIMYLYLEN